MSPARAKPKEGRPAQRAGRPTAKAVRTRARILDTSLELFQEKGFEGASMREIAARAGLSLGATYYHFASKDELVFAFYARTQEDAERDAEGVIARTTRFDERLDSLLAMRLEHLGAYRGFFGALAGQALDFRAPLSPFSEASAETRERAIAIMDRAIEGSDLRVHDSLRKRLPLLLWLVQMAILFLWIHDESPDQRRTRKIATRARQLLTAILAVTTLPVPGLATALDQLGELVDEVEAIGADVVAPGAPPLAEAAESE